MTASHPIKSGSTVSCRSGWKTNTIRKISTAMLRICGYCTREMKFTQCQHSLLPKPAELRFRIAAMEALGGQDFRPAIVTADVENLELVNVSADIDNETESIFRMVDTRNVLISGCRSLSAANSFLKLEGKKSKDVLMLSNDFRKVNKPFILDKNVSSDEVKIK